MALPLAIWIGAAASLATGLGVALAPSSAPASSSPPSSGSATEPSSGAQPSASAPSLGAQPATGARPQVATKAPSSSPSVAPPRFDGVYLGGMPMLGIAAVRVNDLSTDGAFAGAGGQVRVGQMVLPWLGLGLQIGGDYGVRSESGARQQLALGNLLVDLQFVPLHKRRLGWTLRAGFGVGGGAVHQAGVEGRAGFGGAVFSAATGYSFFPVADRRRPDRGGGFAIGPEVGWIGATPASKGGPTAHMFYLAATLLFYFGS